MHVTKTQLRDYINRKIADRRKALHTEITNEVEIYLGSSLDKLFGDLSELERYADRFGDLMDKSIGLIGTNAVSYNAITTMQIANKIGKDARKYFLDNLVSDAVHGLLSYGSFKCEALKPAFNKVSSLLQPKIKLYREGLNTLKDELHAVVSNESTAKKAYNALVALGVDMSDLPEVNPNLPAITKLSVDVCVINDTCKEATQA